MTFLKKKGPGILACFLIALPAWLLGRRFPIIGGPVTAILAGMIIAAFLPDQGPARDGIRWTSKTLLQAAVVLLGFGMDLGVVLRTGSQSLPIILSTISTSLVLAWLLQGLLRIRGNTAVLIGVGSSICGGSAIAATAPVIGADDDEIAQSISVIFLFNIIAAVLFPLLGRALGFDSSTGNAFGIFAGTAINDTSSVTAAASTWDSMWSLGSQTLDKAVTVKLTRTLAIIPITFILALLRAGKAQGEGKQAESFTLRRAFPSFILFFILASLITTVCLGAGWDKALFAPLKDLSKFLIVMAMAAIGLNSSLVKLVRSGGRPIFLGACCWAGITAVSLILQRLLHIW